jgi:hypothetical protein
MKKRAYADVPPFGMVVARIINYSTTETDSTYHIPPLSRAYWYVFSAPSGLRSRVFIRTPGAASPVALLGVERPYEECSHPPFGGAAQAKFRKCDPMTYETASRRTKTGRSYARVPNPFVHPASYTPPPKPGPVVTDVDALLNTDLWVKCAQGCCIAGG